MNPGRLLRVAAAGLASIGAAACDGSPATEQPLPASGAVEANAVVDDIVDGDTIDVIIDGTEERVRLTGIDTPEVAHAATGSRPATVGECFGDEATDFTAGLLPIGTPVRLERDVVGRDDYGRVLAYVYRADDGMCLLPPMSSRT